MLQFKVLKLLFLHSLHQRLEQLCLLLKMLTTERVLLRHLTSYRVRPLNRLLAYQRSNLSPYKYKKA